MADPNPIKTWRIELRGLPSDLASWQQLFTDRAVASVEPALGRDGQSACFVCSQRLDDLRDTEADACAQKLLAQLNGAARLSGLPMLSPVQMECLWYVCADGKPEPMKAVCMTMQSDVEGLATVGASPASGHPDAASRQQKVMQAMDAAAHSDQMALALECFGKPNWYDMWTAYEIIEKKLFMRTDPKLRPKRDRKTNPKRLLLSRRNWVSNDALVEFAESCNYHRHGRKRPPTLQQNANEDEAHRTLTKILQGWLKEFS
jgi:hypothetical protein